MEELIKEYKLILDKFNVQKSNNSRLWNIGFETGRFLYEEVLRNKPSKLLEIGTSNGFSTFWLALAAEKLGVDVDTIEIDKDRLNLARENLRGITNINFILGLAKNIIPKLNCCYDFIFIDACKPEYIDYLKSLLPILNKNALIIADNVVSHEKSVHEYLDFVRNNPIFSTETVIIESGLEITRFLAG